eukprot:TRINITY_DN138_c0_g1_i1.p1 TRINITY_DN138_c0_g1~~TRINITY_DN138_c0_g1_i1.p1  ORF type:complete len:633 (+),score=138.88 TRINITY_DN138_c0_g1_i1:72-1901(+)
MATSSAQRALSVAADQCFVSQEIRLKLRLNLSVINNCSSTSRLFCHLSGHAESSVTKTDLYQGSSGIKALSSFQHEKAMKRADKFVCPAIRTKCPPLEAAIDNAGESNEESFSSPNLTLEEEYYRFLRNSGQELPLLGSGIASEPLSGADASGSTSTSGSLEGTVESNRAIVLGAGSSQNSNDEGQNGTTNSSGWRLKNPFEHLSPRAKGLVLLNLLTLLYGSNTTVIKEAEGSLAPALFSLGRFGIASLVFAPFIVTAFKNKEARKAGVELGMWASAGYLSQAMGLLSTEAGRAAFIGTFTVIEVPFIAGLVGVKIPPITWLAGFAAVCGVSLLESSSGAIDLAGDAWTFGAALLFAIHMLRSEYHACHVDTKLALPIVAMQLFVIAIWSGVWTAGSSFLGMEPSPFAGVSADVGGIWSVVSTWPWFEMAYTGLLSTALCLWIEIVSMKDVSASEAAMVYTLEPLYGAAFAWILLGERWGAMGWFGAALILGGSLTMQLFGKREEEEESVHGSQQLQEKEGSTRRLQLDTAAGELRKEHAKPATAVAFLAVSAVVALAALSRDIASEDVGLQALRTADVAIDGDSLLSLLRMCTLVRMEADMDDRTCL